MSTGIVTLGYNPSTFRKSDVTEVISSDFVSVVSLVLADMTTKHVTITLKAGGRRLIDCLD